MIIVFNPKENNVDKFSNKMRPELPSIANKVILFIFNGILRIKRGFIQTYKFIKRKQISAEI